MKFEKVNLKALIESCTCHVVAGLYPADLKFKWKGRELSLDIALKYARSTEAELALYLIDTDPTKRFFAEELTRNV